MQESDATYDRRAFPLCRPTDCSKGAECERFKTEFINGAQRIEMVTLTTGPAAGGATLEYCLDDILLGMYPTSGVAGAPAGTLNAENTAKLVKAQKRAASILAPYFLLKNFRDALVREAGTHGRNMWVAYLRECEEAPDEQTTSQIKTEIQSSTILSTVGFRESSVSLYKRHITEKNTTIEPAASRISENDLCVKLLTAIGEAAPHLKLAADTELKAAPTRRVHVYPPTHANAGARSLSAIVTYFDGMCGTGAPPRGGAPPPSRTRSG